MKTRKGFTLIELMIVIAIISIIAAIAIPNLMQSRIRANEATAVTAVKNYATAQVTFQAGKQARVKANGAPEDNGKVSPSAYTFAWRNLFYGNPAGKAVAGGDGEAEANDSVNLALISKAHADAFVDDDAGSGDVVTTPTGEGGKTPYQGYHFGNPPEAQDASFFLTDFAQLAVPANSSTTGNNAYWVGQQGYVYAQGMSPDHLTPEEAYGDITTTPSDTDGAGFGDWLGL